MTLLDRLFPYRAKQRAELEEARAVYQATMADRRASRLEVEAAAEANIAALEDVLADARRVREKADAASLAPPANDDE